MSELQFDRGSARRRSVVRPGFRAEVLDLNANEKYEHVWDGSSSYLALHDVILAGGASRIDGRDYGQFRDLRGKLSFMPIGVGSTGWAAQADRQNRFTALYFDQAQIFEKLELPMAANDLAPQVFLNNALLEATLSKLTHAIADASVVEDVLIDALVLIAASEATKVAGARSEATIGRLSDAQVSRVCDLIEAQLDHPVTLGAMAEAAGLSDYHFSRAFKRTMGVSPYRFLLLRRVDRAKQLIRQGKSLTEVIQATGFTGPSQFSRTFTALAGETPREFRKRGL